MNVCACGVSVCVKIKEKDSVLYITVDVVLKRDTWFGLVWCVRDEYICMLYIL